MNTVLEQTRCPHCNIAFYVTATQLKAAQGTVRCGICLNLFEATAHRCQAPITSPAEQADDSPEQPAEPAETTTPIEPEEPENISDSSEKTSNNEPVGEQINSRDDDPDTAAAEAPSPEALEPGPLSLDLDKLAKNLAQANPATSDPDTAHETRLPEPSLSPRQQITRLLGLTASAMLLMALLLQLLFHYSARLSLNPDYRPVVKLLCSQLDCPVAELKDRSLISVEAVSIHKHPSVREALTVEAILLNRAPYAQPFPETILRFEDVRGQILAQRAFGPDQYLPGTLGSVKAMQPSLAYQIRFELVAPDQRAVSYSLIVSEK